MTERSDGVTDARIQAAKVIAGFLKVFKGARRGRNGSATMSPDFQEGVFGALGGRVIEREQWLCAICKANDRADNGLGADAKQKHEAPPSAESIIDRTHSVT